MLQRKTTYPPTRFAHGNRNLWNQIPIILISQWCLPFFDKDRGSRQLFKSVSADDYWLVLTTSLIERHEFGSERVIVIIETSCIVVQTHTL